LGRCLQSLDDRKCSEWAFTELVIHLHSTLEETRVQVENVTGVSLLMARGTTEKEGHLVIGHCLLRQIII